MSLTVEELVKFHQPVMTSEIFRNLLLFFRGFIPQQPCSNQWHDSIYFLASCRCLQFCESSFLNTRVNWTFGCESSFLNTRVNWTFGCESSFLNTRVNWTFGCESSFLNTRVNWTFGSQLHYIFIFSVNSCHVEPSKNGGPLLQWTLGSTPRCKRGVSIISSKS